jgi:poly(3-hydroxybutyrate) depolymerase
MTSMKILPLSRHASPFAKSTGGPWRWARAALQVTLLALGLGLPSTAFGYACPQNPPPPKTETYQGFLGRVYELNGQQLPYRLFVPKDYDPTKAYPLVLYLHHAGLAGTDANNDTDWDNCVHLTSEIGSGNDYGGVFTHQAVDKDGKRFDTQQRYPHFVLAPHANSPAYGFGGGVAGSASGAEHATRPLLMGILADVQGEFKIDPARLYVTGISMGCYGTWDLIMRKPGLFAAASPQSCRGDPDTKLLAALKNMPIWSMCGTNDSYFAGAQAMANGMKEVGATDDTFTFTAMEGVGHSINDRGYDYPGFIDWMFEQSLASDPGGGGSGGGGNGGASGASAAGASLGGNAGAAAATSGGAGGGFPAGSAGASAASSAAGSPASAGSSGGQNGQAVPPSGTAGAQGMNAAEATDSSGCSVVGSPLSSTRFGALGALALVSAFWRRNQRNAKRKTGMFQ